MLLQVYAPKPSAPKPSANRNTLLFGVCTAHKSKIKLIELRSMLNVSVADAFQNNGLAGYRYAAKAIANRHSAEISPITLPINTLLASRKE